MDFDGVKAGLIANNDLKINSIEIVSRQTKVFNTE